MRLSKNFLCDSLWRGQYWNRRSYDYYYWNDKKVKLPLHFRIDIYDYFPTGKQDQKVAYFLSKIHSDKKYKAVELSLANVTDDEMIDYMSGFIYWNYNFNIIERVIDSIG